MTINKLAKIISQNSLFEKGGTFSEEEAKSILKNNKFKFCTGKYKKTIKNKIKELMKKHNKIIWYETRSDKEGSYYVLYSINYFKMNQKLSNKLTNLVLKSKEVKGVG